MRVGNISGSEMGGDILSPPDSLDHAGMLLLIYLIVR